MAQPRAASDADSAASSEGLSVFNVLQRRGVPSKLLYFPDENHWVRAADERPLAHEEALMLPAVQVMKPRNSLVWHREVLAWLLKYSNATAPAAGEDHAPAAAGLTFQ